MPRTTATTSSAKTRLAARLVGIMVSSTAPKNHRAVPRGYYIKIADHLNPYARAGDLNDRTLRVCLANDEDRDALVSGLCPAVVSTRARPRGAGTRKPRSSRRPPGIAPGGSLDDVAGHEAHRGEGTLVRGLPQPGDPALPELEVIPVCHGIGHPRDHRVGGIPPEAEIGEGHALPYRGADDGDRREAADGGESSSAVLSKLDYPELLDCAERLRCGDSMSAPACSGSLDVTGVVREAPVVRAVLSRPGSVGMSAGDPGYIYRG